MHKDIYPPIHFPLRPQQVHVSLWTRFLLELKRRLLGIYDRLTGRAAPVAERGTGARR